MADLNIDPPDTDLARRARDLLHETCPPHVAAHCERSSNFAALIARTEAIVVDLEVLYIGTLLHDIGLATQYGGPERFEMRGANAVRTMLLEAGRLLVDAPLVAAFRLDANQLVRRTN